MPVPVQSSSDSAVAHDRTAQQQRPLQGVVPRNRPSISARACSYQDTSRYRAPSTAPGQSAATANPDHALSDDGPVTAVTDATPVATSEKQAGLVGNETPKPAPFSAANRPVLTRGFTRDAWVKQLAGGGPSQAQTPLHTPRGSSPFVPGYVATSSGKNTPVSEFGSAGVWGPASPSLAGKFTFEHDLETPSQNADGASAPKQTFAFTVHAARHLSAVSRPGTPTDESGDPIPESVTETADRLQEGHDRVEETPATGRQLMVAVDGADNDGLTTLEWACKNVVQPGDTLTVVRIVRELKGFKGGYAAASDMLRTIESRARAEADRVTCHAIRELGREGKKAVDVYVKYRVGEPRSAIRDLVAAQRPRILVVGNTRQRVAAGALRTPGPTAHGAGNIFFHGGHETFVPDTLHGQVEVLVAQ